MLVERVWTPAGEYRVTGDGYAPEGTFEPAPGDDPALDRLVARRRRVQRRVAPRARPPRRSVDDHGRPDRSGTARARRKARRRRRPTSSPPCPRVEELTFDSERRRMATLHAAGRAGLGRREGRPRGARAVARRADEPVLRRADVVAAGYAADGYRVLAFAERTIADLPARLDDAERGSAISWGSSAWPIRHGRRPLHRSRPAEPPASRRS